MYCEIKKIIKYRNKCIYTRTRWFPEYSTKQYLQNLNMFKSQDVVDAIKITMPTLMRSWRSIVTMNLLIKLDYSKKRKPKQ